jgi:D-amino-acid dehydrogenase
LTPVRVVVLGAGVLGLATAYYLRRDGREVIVVDRNDGVALETSYANGAQLAYSYVAPLAGPGVLPKIPPWLLRRDSPLRFYPALDARQWSWLWAFILACNRRQSELTTRRMLALSFYSRDLMRTLLAEEGIEFGHARKGKLVVHSDEAGFEAARRLVDYQRSLGCEQSALTREECLALEPALGASGSALGTRLVGGIFTPSEEVGDCYRFCVGLEHRLEAMGVELRLATQVEALVAEGGRVVRALASGGPIDADAFVVAAGTLSPLLTAPLGIRLPIYPLKGYSLTLPVKASAPSVSVTDFTRKVVYAPLTTPAGAALRVAGMADIAGYALRPDPVRVSQLVAEARAAFPSATDYDVPVERLQPWTGLRPATPEGAPRLGPTRVANLFVNAGHGPLGWTLALGSGRVVADTVAGRTPAVPLEGFRPD